jgi:hypothetical protein
LEDWCGAFRGAKGCGEKKVIGSKQKGRKGGLLTRERI